MLLRLQWLLMLIYNPARAMARIAAAAPYVFGALLALLATVLYSDILSRQSLQEFAQIANNPRQRGLVLPVVFLTIRFASRLAVSASPLFFLTVIFVPACVFAARLLDRRASFMVRLRQDYAPLVSCALYAWAMAQLLMIVPALTVYQTGGPNPQMTEAILRQFAPLPYFLFLMIFALRAALRLSVGRAIGAAALGACSFVVMGFM